MNILLDYLRTALAFMVIITVLVAVHELGHFWFARMLGMKVEAFAVMMGGLRRTRLDHRLKKPLVSGTIVCLVVGILAGMVTMSGIAGWATGFQVSLFGLAVLAPLWIASRLQALYHLPGHGAYQILMKSWIGGAALLGFSTRFKGVGLENVLGILFFSSLVGLLLIYYQPVLQKEDDAPMGKGSLPTEDGGTEPVNFRPLLARKDRHGTEFSLLLLPLGGFASIKGMHPKDDGSETQIEGGFYSKSPFARFLVLFAGPLFSILLGIVFLTGYFVVRGTPTELSRIGQMEATSPAAKAGLKRGDLVTQVQGQPVKTWMDMVKVVRDRGGMPTQFVINRDGQSLNFTITPKLDEEPMPVLDDKGEPTEEKRKQGRIGARRDEDPMALGPAFTRACQAPIAMVAGLAGVIAKPSTAKDSVGGPATIVQTTHEASEGGIIALVGLAGLMSISLGVMNLLPIPPLDGGQIVVAITEMLRGGRRLSIGVQRTVQTLGFFMVLGLMVLMIALDIGRSVGRN